MAFCCAGRCAATQSAMSTTCICQHSRCYGRHTGRVIRRLGPTLNARSRSFALYQLVIAGVLPASERGDAHPAAWRWRGLPASEPRMSSMRPFPCAELSAAPVRAMAWRFRRGRRTRSHKAIRPSTICDRSACAEIYRPGGASGRLQPSASPTAARTVLMRSPSADGRKLTSSFTAGRAFFDPRLVMSFKGWTVVKLLHRC